MIIVLQRKLHKTNFWLFFYFVLWDIKGREKKNHRKQNQNERKTSLYLPHFRFSGGESLSPIILITAVMFFFYLSIFFVHEYTRLFSPEVIAESVRIEVKYRYIFSFKFGIEKFLQVEIFVFDWLKVLLPVKSLQNKWNSYKKIIRSALILYQHSINILFPRVIFRKYWWYILYIFSI